MFLCSCNKSSKKINITEDVTQFTDFAVSKIPKSTKKEPLNLRLKRDRTKLGYTINTFSNKYLSVLSNDGSKLYFSALDWSVFFDFKLDFTKEKSARGKDIFVINLKGRNWENFRPLTFLSPNGHEIVSQDFATGDLLITSNYQEKFGVNKDRNAGVQITELFFIRFLQAWTY